MSAPLAVGEERAAGLLDLTPAQFRGLVEAGTLPAPRRIGPHERWDVEALWRIARGEAADGMEGVPW